MKYINGDLLHPHINIDVILQQTNCLTVSPHGLSENIAKIYPYARVYENRRPIGNRNLAIEQDRDIPGTVKWFCPPDSGPIVGCIFGQYQPGKPGNSYGGARISTMGSTIRGQSPYPLPPGSKIRETREMRLEWFKQGLENVREDLIGMFGTDKINIGIPYKIGCGLAGGVWNDYENALKEFSEKLPENINVIIFKFQPSWN